MKRAGSVKVVGMREDTSEWKDVIVVNTTSRAGMSWERTLSPFNLGPIRLYGRRVSLTMENAWQYSKVYRTHTDFAGEPTREYWEWAEKGWADPQAQRYPMGRGARPEYSLWKGEHLGYVRARKVIYAPLYARAVVETTGFKRLKRMFRDGRCIILRDFDGYDHGLTGKTLSDVLNDPEKKMGHAFVLMALLTNDPSMEEWKT